MEGLVCCPYLGLCPSLPYGLEKDVGVTEVKVSLKYGIV